MKKPKVSIPEEDPAVGALRDRQVADLASVDEEENRRLKAAFSLRRGVRAFRGRSGSAKGSTSPIGSTTTGRAFIPNRPGGMGVER